MHIILIAMGIFLLIIGLGLSTLGLGDVEHIIFFSLAVIMFFMAKIYSMIKAIYNKETSKED